MQKQKNVGDAMEGAVGEAMTEDARRQVALSSKEEGMLDNNIYNLIEQLNIENRSLWRIKKNYKADAQISNCQSCKDYWDKLEKQKEVNIRELTDLLRDQQWSIG